MDVNSIMSDCVRNLGLRIGPHTGTYLFKHLQSGRRADKIPVMGGDARTGLPVRTFIVLDRLAQNLNHSPATTA